MKAIILEIKNGCAAALREDGLVVKTRQLGEIGSTVELDEKVVAFPKQRGRILRAAVAAALVLAVTGGSYTYTNVLAAAYVTLDTEETSVEFSVNRAGRVVDVRALDDASTELAESLSADVRRMRVEDAVDIAMTHMDGASTVVAGVTGGTEARSIALQEAVERGIGRAEREGMELITLEVTPQERREADERDMSGGRYVFERDEGGFRHGGYSNGGNALPAEPAFEGPSADMEAPEGPRMPFQENGGPPPEAESGIKPPLSGTPDGWEPPQRMGGGPISGGRPSQENGGLAH